MTVGTEAELDIDATVELELDPVDVAELLLAVLVGTEAGLTTELEVCLAEMLSEVLMALVDDLEDDLVEALVDEDLTVVDTFLVEVDSGLMEELELFLVVL